MWCQWHLRLLESTLVQYPASARRCGRWSLASHSERASSSAGVSPARISCARRMRPSPSASSLAFGAGTPTTTGPQGTTPNIATYEANCPEFVTSGTRLGCGDYRPMGGPYCDGLASTTTVPSCINQPGDVLGTGPGVQRPAGALVRDRPAGPGVRPAAIAGRGSVAAGGGGAALGVDPLPACNDAPQSRQKT